MKRYLRTRVPIIKNLYRNFNENVRLEETLEEIKKAIEKTEDKRIKKNLKKWQKQYEIKVKLPKELREAVTTKGIITKEKVLQNYIYENGFICDDLKITKFIKEKQLRIGAIDLFGDDKYIIELKKVAKSRTIGQTLAYHQYLKSEEDKEYPIIIIAGKFWENYKYAHQAIKDIGIDIRAFVFGFCEEGIFFKEILK